MGAKHLPRGLLEYQAAEQLPNKDARIVVHCGFGGRSALASDQVPQGDMGYTNVANIDGGITAWRERGYESE